MKLQLLEPKMKGADMADNRDQAPVRGNLTLEDVRLLFKNFKGAAGKYNQEGNRNFVVVLDPELADILRMDGWNVRELQPRDGDGEPTLYLPVKVSYRGRPPRITMITSRGKTEINEETVGLLDYADLLRVDLIVRPYHYDVNGRQGISAYLKTMFVTINEDELEMKYASPEQDAIEEEAF